MSIIALKIAKYKGNRRGYMLKEEMIELNGKEYTLTLNRQSALKIEQYTNELQSIFQLKIECHRNLPPLLIPFLDDHFLK